MGLEAGESNGLNSLPTVKYSILVNRAPVGFFSPQNGLRQADPLAPFLFLLAMEGLSKILDKAILSLD